MTNQILALPAECWRWYDGYVDLYQVSTRGQVRGVDRWVIGKDGKKHFYKGRILKPQRDRNGYLRVNLWRDGKGRWILVHRMVLEVWGDGNPEGKPEVNHLDEDKSNNEVYNLEWCTHKENSNFGTRNERRAASMLNGSKSKPIQALDPSTGVVVFEFPSMMEAQRKGFHHANIWSCCRGKRRIHKGFAWRYKP